MGPEREQSKLFAAWPRLAMALLCALVVGVALAACGGGGSSSSESTEPATGTEAETAPAEETEAEGPEEEGGGEEASAAELEAAEEATEAAFEGRFGTPPSESNPAPKNKSIFVISPGQASAPAAALAAAAIEAGKALGWKTTLCDGKLDPSKEADCYRTAIAAKTEGIIGIATDCPAIKAQLEEAKAAKIPVVPVFSFDCGEVGQGSDLFTTQISFGSRYENVIKYFEASGEDAAAWVVSTNEGKANVLSADNKEYLDLVYWQNGFAKGMEKYCAACPFQTVDYLVAEFGPGLQEKIATGLVQNPELNGIQMTWNPELGPEAAVEASGKIEELATIGGLGVASDTAAVTEKGSLKAVIGQPLPWWSYGAVDTLISLYNGSEPRDEGIGWQLFTKEQNAPKSGEGFSGPVNFKAAFEKSWGV